MIATQCVAFDSCVGLTIVKARSIACTHEVHTRTVVPGGNADAGRGGEVRGVEAQALQVLIPLRLDLLLARLHPRRFVRVHVRVLQREWPSDGNHQDR